MTAARPGLALLSALFSFFFVSLAAAGIKTEVSARRVGVGQTFVVQVTFTQEEDEASPEAPQLKVSGAAEVEGPSISSQTSVRMHNFSFSSEKNVIARWQVTPQKEGTLKVGPGSFQVGGRRVSGESVTIEVLKDAPPSAAQPRRRSIFGNDPTDPFGNDPFDDFFNRRTRQVQIPDAPPEYQIAHASDPVAFLDARLSKKTVVLGEPVVLTVLAYGAAGDFGEIAPQEPPLADFLSYRAMDNIQSEPPYQLDVEGRVYVVRKLREYILIPLKTGALTVGGLTTALQNNRRGYPKRKHAQGYSVSSSALTLVVTEAPSKERPSGYTQGDVGQYQLAAELSSRQVKQGEFAELLVRITGEGHIPTQVILPQQNGLVWEGSAMSGGPEVQDGTLRGTRTLKYPLQLNVPGRIELGEVTLPVFDQKIGKYVVLRAALGHIEVSPAPVSQVAPVDPSSTSTSSSPTAPVTPAASNAQTVQALAQELRPRAAAAAVLDQHGPKFPLWSLWAMVLLPVSIAGGGALVQGARSAVRTRRATPRSNTKSDFRAAEEALREGDKNRALQLAERALFDAIEQRTGLKARGVMREAVARSLMDHGLGESLALEIQSCLLQLEANRYGSTELDPLSLFAQVSSLIQRMPTAKKARNA